MSSISGHVFSSRILYKSNTYDPDSQLPVYILDSYFLPSSLLISEQIKSDEELLNKLISHIEEPFALIVLSSSLNSIQNSRLAFKFVKLFKSIPQNKMNLLQKIYIVHHNWLTKSMLDLVSVFNKKPSLLQIIHCEDLTTLSRFLDLTKLNISLPTYVYDHSINAKIVVPIHLEPVFKHPLLPGSGVTFATFQRLYNKLLDYLRLDSYTDLGLLLVPNLPRLTLVKIDILSECIRRQQLMNLSDWSFAEIYEVLMRLLGSLNDIGQPLVPISVLIDDISDIDDLLDHQYSWGPQNLSYNNRYVILKVFRLSQIIYNKIHHERGELLFVLELSKKLFNLNYSTETVGNNHSQVFNIFFEFMKLICRDEIKLQYDSHDRVDEEVLKSVAEVPLRASLGSPLTPPRLNDAVTAPTPPPRPLGTARDSFAAVKTSGNFPPTPPLPRKLLKMTINQNNSLASVTSSDSDNDDDGLEDGTKVKEYPGLQNDENKENVDGVESVENVSSNVDSVIEGKKTKTKTKRLVELHAPQILPEQYLQRDKVTQEIKLKPWVRGKKVGELALFYEKEMDRL